VIELDSPYASIVQVGTQVFSFLILGDQNAGKSTFLHAFTYLSLEEGRQRDKVERGLHPLCNLNSLFAILFFMFFSFPLFPPREREREREEESLLFFF
jgi:GTPase SAR1 family protein